MKLLIIMALFSTSVFSASNAELERKVDILADEIAQLKASQQQIGTGETIYGLGQSASKVYFLKSGLSIGGYGEITYSNQSHENENGDATNREPKSEALRNVIYLGYKYSDKWILNTEIEIEHTDEIFNEFMYVDYLANDFAVFRLGLFLVPMGITNELHEPIYFNSVNRPEVEKYLIPTTWREIGVGILAAKEKYTLKLFHFNGPNADGIVDDGNGGSNIGNGIRSGRKKGGVNNNASTSMAVGRLDYNIDSSNIIGASFLRGSASSSNSGNDYIDMEMRIFDLHGTFKNNGIGAKFLYVDVEFENASAWNDQAASAHYIPNSMGGFYVEFDYDIEREKGAVLTPFVRYESYDLTKDTDEDTFGERVKSRERTNTVVGVAYKPVDRLVLKADYMYKHRADDSGVNEFNLGLGFVY